ncbi:MAG TPA: hypothetical protein V6D19_06600 [Stenomitos sp.]
MRLNLNDPRLQQRYIELIDAQNWRELPKEKIGQIAFGSMPFWEERARFLSATSEDELLAKTPVAGRFSLPNKPTLV